MTEKAREWLSIESAPKDGTIVHVSRPGRMLPVAARWGKSTHYGHLWRCVPFGIVDFEPTRWMPLPDPPEPQP